jgi:hypothetical protein
MATITVDAGDLEIVLDASSPSLANVHPEDVIRGARLRLRTQMVDAGLEKSLHTYYTEGKLAEKPA